jgi:hypothetical protein
VGHYRPSQRSFDLCQLWADCVEKVLLPIIGCPLCTESDLIVAQHQNVAMGHNRTFRMRTLGYQSDMLSVLIEPGSGA